MALVAVACEDRLGSVEDMGRADRAEEIQAEELPAEPEEHPAHVMDEQVLVVVLAELELHALAEIAQQGQLSLSAE